MKTKDNISQDFEKRKHDYVLDFIREKDLINSEGNVIFSQKIFVINSVLKWCLDSVAEKKMTKAKWEKFSKILAQYIAGTVDLKWNDGSLEVIETQQNDKKRRKRRTRNQIK